MTTDASLTTDVTYEDLIALEYDFDEADTELLRAQEKRLAPLYSKRAALAARIPNFWALVIEQAPTDLDQYIQPSDSQVFAEALEDLQVERFEPDVDIKSICIKLKFKQNEWFEDEVLEKKLYSRRGKDGSVGLVSEPVAIKWKKGKDLTSGLTNAAVKLWHARSEAQKIQQESKDYKSLAAKLESNDPSANSFFTFFGFVSEKRYISAAESKEATETTKRKRATQQTQSGKAAASEDAGMLTEEEEQAELDAMDAEQAVEICPHGAEVATFIAENLWPHAIKYFTSAQEQDDEDLSEADFEDDEDDDDDESGGEIDIRSLVKGKGGSSSKRGKGYMDVSDEEMPPAKSRRR